MRAVYRAYVLDEEDIKKVVKKPTFFTQLVFDAIKEALEEENDMIFSYSTKAWQHRLTRKLVTYSNDPQTGLSSLMLTGQEEQLASGYMGQHALPSSLCQIFFWGFRLCPVEGSFGMSI